MWRYCSHVAHGYLVACSVAHHDGWLLCRALGRRPLTTAPQHDRTHRRTAVSANLTLPAPISCTSANAIAASGRLGRIVGGTHAPIQPYITSTTAHSNADSHEDITDEQWEEVVGILGSMAATKNRPNAAGGWRDAFEYMPVHMQRAGITPERLASLNFIHVAGTKGKGSTCAMVESILRRAGYRTGLFTSPHLVDVRERIRLDGRMLPRSEFAASFRRVYGALRSAAEADGPRGVGMPAFFPFMTLLAMDAFLSHPPARRPHVVVLEVGIGGRLDATNGVLTRGSLLAAAAVTSLGFDHMELLGHTLPAIAREKAGIMKAGRPVFVAPQPDDAMAALQEVADRVGARLAVPPPLERYRLTPRAARPAAPAPAAAAQPQGETAHAAANGDGDVARSQADTGLDPGGLRLGLGGAHMRLNASLAVALAAEWEGQYGRAAAAAASLSTAADAGAVAAAMEAAAGRPVALAPGGPAAAAAAARAAEVAAGLLPPEYEEGLRSVQWPGRSQVVHDDVAAARGGRLTFYLDGAHSPESMATCADWFGRELAKLLPAGGGGGGSGAPAAAHGGGAALLQTDGSQRRHVAALLFCCMPPRDPAALLQALAQALAAAGVNTHGGGGGGVEVGSVVFTPVLSGKETLLPAPAPSGQQSAAAPSTAASPAPAHQSQAQLQAQSHVQPSSPPTAAGLGWQEGMRGAWAALHPAPTGAAAAAANPSTTADAEPRPQQGGGAGGDVGEPPLLPGLPRVWVAPSLPAALGALRVAAAADPRVAVHVLVTGSLYLVGDTLRLLGRPPA